MKSMKANRSKPKCSKKGLSKVKKKTIQMSRLSRQGLLSKENRKKNRKEKKSEQRRTYYQHLEQTRKEEEQKKEEPSQEITGQDMLEMMDNDDVDTFMNRYNKEEKKEKGKTLGQMENEGRSFKEYEEKVVPDKKKMKQFLPVMTSAGWEDREAFVSKKKTELVLSSYKRPEKTKPTEDKDEKDDSGISGDEEDEEDEEEDKDIQQATVAQIFAARKRKVHRKKVKMACLALNLIQDPTDLINLHKLLEIVTESDPDSEVTIRKCASLTLLQVFNDLIPGYRVQENTLQQKVKKQTLTTAKVEMDFLACYRKFLKALEDVLEALKRKPKSRGLNTLSETSLHCLGSLLSQHPHFNYSVNIVQAIVPYLNHTNVALRKLACTSLSQTIKADKSCFLALEVVRKVYKLTHRLRFKVKSEVLRLFLSLRVSEMRNQDAVSEQQKDTRKALSHKERLIKKLHEQAQVKPSKKQKREKKKIAKIREQMADINTQEVTNVQNVRHSEITETVFGLYIHVLKNRPKSRLMSVVLEGLARFSHLINIEFFSDLLALMNEFLVEGILGRRESLHCIQTVFTILSGQGETLNIDPQTFYNQFYCILIELRTVEKDKNLTTLLRILEQMLIQRRKKVSAAKALSFSKRMATLALTLPHQSAIPVLAALKKVLTTFTPTEALLDTDPEGSPGMFLPETTDPEHSNSVSTALWDMVLSKQHYHPVVRTLSHNILSGVPAREVPLVHNITKRTADELIKDFGHDVLKFNPAITHPNDHLKKKTKKGPAKRFFENGSLDLDNLKLQSVCERVLAEKEANDEDAEEGEPPGKRARVALSYYEALVGEEEGAPATLGVPLVFRKVKDFTSHFVQEK